MVQALPWHGFHTLACMTHLPWLYCSQGFFSERYNLSILCFNPMVIRRTISYALIDVANAIENDRTKEKVQEQVKQFRGWLANKIAPK